ncbi:MAG: hypothetical protein M3388_07355 [Acidobacteriota bacterium]|nr:hypothetical protein [Acidobacteriota bacterium]
MSIENCSDSLDALFSLIEEVKLGYQEPTEAVRRGRKPTFSNLSFLLLAVAAVVTKTFSDSELHRLLSKDTALREALEFPRVPHRTRILRRLKRLVPVAEEQIALFGKSILTATAKDENHSSVSAVDGRMYQAVGPKWHKKDRREGVIPVGLRNVDVESSWSRVGLSRLDSRLSDSFANLSLSRAGAAFCRLARELPQ